MKRMLIRYRTRPEASQQNRTLIEDVFRELQAKSPEGVRYMVLTLGDGSVPAFPSRPRTAKVRCRNLTHSRCFRAASGIVAPNRRRRARRSSSAITACWGER